MTSRSHGLRNPTVNSKELFHARWPDRRITDFQATYHDIVENECTIPVYDMCGNREKLSVSLQTAEFRADGGGTRLIHTKQGTYLTGGVNAVKSHQHDTA